MKNKTTINYLKLAEQIENATTPLFIIKASRSNMSAKITIFSDGQFLIREFSLSGWGTERGFLFLYELAIAAKIEHPDNWANEQRRKFSNFLI